MQFQSLRLADEILRDLLLSEAWSRMKTFQLCLRGVCYSIGGNVWRSLFFQCFQHAPHRDPLNSLSPTSFTNLSLYQLLLLTSITLTETLLVLLPDFVEHIAELGSDHLQMAGHSMPWHVRHRYDTGLFFLLLMGLPLFGVIKIFAKLYKGFNILISNKNKVD